MLKVWRQDDGLVSCFSRKLYTQVPGVESDEREFIVLGYKVLLREGIEAINGIAKSTSSTDMLPCKSCQAC